MLRTIVGLALASTALAASPAHQYDFLVVGGGTSGLVIANRLSENPFVSVAIIEAGGSVFGDQNVASINGYGSAFGTKIDWAYQSEPQVYAGNKTQILRAGKALGGTSTINGMTYLRAETSQIDAFAKIGINITWATLLPYYKKSERFQVPSGAQHNDGFQYDAAVHGFIGPLTVGWPLSMSGSDFPRILNSTFDSIGLPWNGEPNSGRMRGFNIFPRTIDRVANVREDAARAYYLPVLWRPNLHVYPNSFAERLTWLEPPAPGSLPKANGVIVRDVSGNALQFSAQKEVILSAGSLRSPVILEQSGVGNPTILRQHGIDVKVELPAVGENLQDQTAANTVFRQKQSSTGVGAFIGYYNARDVFGNDTAKISAKIKGSLSDYAQAVVRATGGVVNQTAIERLFHIQHKLIFEDLAVISEIIVVAPFSGMVLLEYWGLLPFSRGSIHINSANATAPASINPNYFHLDWDIQQQIATARAARVVANTAPFSNLVGEELTPGLGTVPAGASEEVWGAWSKSVFRSNFHYISTAAMMPRDLGGVVDSDHLVYGTSNVRVVDASALPFQVSGHLVSTLYALAERAADRIKARYLRG